MGCQGKEGALGGQRGQDGAGPWQEFENTFWVYFCVMGALFLFLHGPGWRGPQSSLELSALLGSSGSPSGSACLLCFLALAPPASSPLAYSESKASARRCCWAFLPRSGLENRTQREKLIIPAAAREAAAAG